MESTPNEVNKLGVTRHFHSKDVMFCTCILRHIEVDLKMFLAEEIVPLHEESLTPEHLWQRLSKFIPLNRISSNKGRDTPGNM